MFGQNHNCRRLKYRNKYFIFTSRASRSAYITVVKMAKFKSVLLQSHVDTDNNQVLSVWQLSPRFDQVKTVN